MPSEFRRPKEVVAASKSSFGHASGSRYEGDVFAPWNARLEYAYRSKAINQLAAKSLQVPESLPASHPVVISASKGGIGAAPKAVVQDAKGQDEGWCAGLNASYFHPDALSLVIGDGKDVSHDFTLYPEDPEGSHGADLGGVSRGSTSSRKRLKLGA